MRWQVIASIIVILVLTALSVWGLLPAISQPSTNKTNLFTNGDFEMGFAVDPNCGLVGIGWRCFKEGSHTRFVVQPETWPAAVRTGRYAQLLGMITSEPGAPPDRVLGIFQRVHVVPGKEYTLVVRGLIRANDHDPDPWRYVVEWGHDPQGGTDWRAVSQWHILPWNRYDPREAPGPYQEYTTSFVPASDRITVFVRLRNKWGAWPREVILNLDDLALVGPKPATVQEPLPTATPPARPVAPPRKPTPRAADGLQALCPDPNLVANGDFEQGMTANGVAYGWLRFTEGGPASFGFWDAGLLRQNPGDAHGQVIALDTTGLPSPQGALTAGILQTVEGLTPGHRYRVCLRGSVQAHPASAFGGPPAAWGVGASRITWHVIPWMPGTGSMPEDRTFAADFTATASRVTIGLRVEVPAGLRVEDVQLVVREVRLVPTTTCLYTVQPGDTAEAIARRYNTTVQDLLAQNGLEGPNAISVSRMLQVPCPNEAP